VLADRTNLQPYFRPIQRSRPVLYGGSVLAHTFRQLWAEPRITDAPRRVWRDWVLVAIVVAVAIVEIALRTDLPWRPIPLVLGVPPIMLALWRRTHPLVVTAVVFGVHASSHAVMWLGADHSAMLYTTVWIAILPYALFRWGSGRECTIGLGVMLLGHIPTEAGIITSIGDVAGAAVFLLVPALVGTAVRYRSSSKLREVDQVKMREREQLARELHDTVAHHVSAIIVQAQAGQAVAGTNHAAAVTTLEVIEAEASRTLSEMRFMVGALRQGDDVAFSPQRGVMDISLLAREKGQGPIVAVHLAGRLDDLRPVVGAALYRLAQESVTNARRHARYVTRVDVSVTSDDDSVQLVVRDDGDASVFGSDATSGYGIIGMAERAKLLGGTLVAGPGMERGWSVVAVLPRESQSQ
jgi:signal transduction histidine kinase